MAICVTEKMIDAAHRQLPGISNRVRIRIALEAACALVPDGAPADVPVTARIRVQIDEEQVRTAVADAIAQQQAELDMPPRGLLSDVVPLTPEGRAEWRQALNTLTQGIEPHVTAEGLQGNGVTDATGSATTITVNEPRILAGVSEIGARLNAPRSTIATWVKNRPDNGMPAPIVTLKAGPVYDLDAVEAWYRAWKGGD